MSDALSRYKAISGPTSLGNGDSTVPLEVGMIGFSIEAIPTKKQGFVLMPLGPRDSTKLGGRKLVKIKLTALEAIHANREVIVITENGEIKEFVVVVTIPQLPGALTADGNLSVSVPEMTSVLTTLLCSFITQPALADTVTNIALTYDDDGFIKTAVFTAAAPYTLTFTWADGRLTNVSRA